MGKVNKYTQVQTSVKVVDDKLEHHGQAGYVVDPPQDDDGEVGVKLDVDGEVYYFAQSAVETLV